MRNTVSFITLACFLCAALAPAAQADIISTESFVRQSAADAERARIGELLQREEVRSKMLAMGVDPAQLEARLAGLSDEEARQLARHMDEMPAGAGVLDLLLVVFLVFVILDIAGVTDVFPFINEAG